jgi:hypothetical protein
MLFGDNPGTAKQGGSLSQLTLVGSIPTIKYRFVFLKLFIFYGMHVKADIIVLPVN